MKAFGMKILLPSIVALSIKIAIQSKNKAVTIAQIIISFVTGVGSAYLFSGVILENVTEAYIPLWIASVTISGEKIGVWLVYKFNVDAVLSDVIEKLEKLRK